MAAGVDFDNAGNPWIITFNGVSATLPLPAVIIGPQNTGNEAYQFIPKRIRWVSKTASAGDQVILKDVPPGGNTARVIEEFVASGADQDGVDEARPRAHESFTGLQVTKFDSGTLYIYL